MNARIEELTWQLDDEIHRVERLRAELADVTRQRDAALAELVHLREVDETADAMNRELEAQCKQTGSTLREILAAIPADLLERFAVARSELPSLPEVFGEQRILRADELRRRILARLAR